MSNSESILITWFCGILAAYLIFNTNGWWQWLAWIPSIIVCILVLESE